MPESLILASIPVIFTLAVGFACWREHRLSKRLLKLESSMNEYEVDKFNLSQRIAILEVNIEMIFRTLPHTSRAEWITLRTTNHDTQATSSDSLNKNAATNAALFSYAETKADQSLPKKKGWPKGKKRKLI